MRLCIRSLLTVALVWACVTTSSHAEDESEYEQLAHLLLSDSATERRQGTVLLRQYVTQSGDDDAVMERILHALRVWANDPLRLAFDRHTPFDHADRWRVALLDAQPRSLRPKQETPPSTEADETDAPEGNRADETLRPRLYRLHVDMLETLSERFRPINKDRSGRWIMGIIMATDARHREIQTAIQADVRARLAAVPDDVSRVPPPALGADTPSRDTGEGNEPNWDALFPQLKSLRYNVRASLVSVPQASADTFADEHGAARESKTGVALGPRDITPLWKAAVGKLSDVTSLLAERTGTLQGGRPLDMPAGDPVVFNRSLSQSQAGAKWSIVMGSIEIGYSIRLQVVDVDATSVRVRVRLRHVHMPKPMPSMEVVPEGSVRSFEIHQPQWTSRERERELTIPKAGSAALLLAPSLDTATADRQLILILGVAPNAGPPSK